MVIQAQIVGRRLSIIYSMVMAFLTEALPAKEKRQIQIKLQTDQADVIICCFG